MRRLLELLWDLFDAECSRTEAWRILHAKYNRCAVEKEAVESPNPAFVAIYGIDRVQTVKAQKPG